ncbi:MAG: nitroreductase [Thermoprotei archaeon]|nr:MAG: nitroreductase [Thermoprotei archaeon]
MVIVCISLVIVTYKVLEIFSIPERKPEVGEVYVENRTLVYLPLPKLKGEVSLEEALSMRRSIREYSGKPLSLEVLAQVLWAAQGINEVKRGFRTAPSAGATYPLEVYVVVKEGGVIDLKAGIYHYNVFLHALELVKIGDFSEELAEAALGQRWVRDAMINLIIVAIYDRTTARYGDRGYRYVHMEVGHVGQNIYLQSCVLGLGTVAVGAFHDDQVREILSVPLNYHPLYIMPIGYAKEPYKLSFENLEEFYMEQRSMYGE